ncbi:hypothetical protein T02_2765 [Trichinella nativa]|uniref:Uncharacterized protein n=1 Tax=Trichinella nativa TaxID=6335 RepID=A0A0V1L5S9_9BILA|nr:hypothetical protein T02_2765 [Trichinella nativa]
MSLLQPECHGQVRPLLSGFFQPGRTIPPEFVLTKGIQGTAVAELISRIFAVGQCRHWEGSVRLRIYCTRFAKNGFHLRGSSWIQLKTIVLSLQQVDQLKGRHNSRSTYSFRHAARSETIDSSRGRLIRLTRVTQVLVMQNLTTLIPSRDSIITYATAQYAASEASAKTCNSYW